MTEPRVGAEQWLAAALSGGLPEPRLRRWQPLRVGIVNLWEYDNAEFWFADGRLVLRGGNGAGKTKVLELTTLMLLRGEIVASALDPFGSQHRSMRFNLLPTGEADDPRPPADSGLGYAWAEFGRRDDDGQAHYFVCGLGASVRRGTGTSDVSRWQLITSLRPGRDFTLSSMDRPLEQKDLKKIDGIRVLDNATRYRSHLAAELFGLGPDAYDNLTELLKQLRKPKLGERLNPGSLAETLRDALPPLANTEIDQLADGWDRLEQLRDAVEQTKDAAAKVAHFVRNGWLPWARSFVRRRADELTSATTKLDDTTKARRNAEINLGKETAEVERLDKALRIKQDEHEDLNTKLRVLLESAAYTNAVNEAQRVETLKAAVDSLVLQHESAEGRASDGKLAVDDAADVVGEAASDIEQATAEADNRTKDVEAHAETAGLTESTRRYLADRDLAVLRADRDVRAERFTHLKQRQREFDKAHAEAGETAKQVSSREDDVVEAIRDEKFARRSVETAVDDLRQSIREWAEGATTAACPADLVETWCDQVADLTAEAPNAGPESTFRDSISDFLNEVRGTLHDRRDTLRSERDPLAREREEKTGQVRALREQTDQPPPTPDLWRRRERPSLDAGQGAALWQCVTPADEVPPAELDLLEAAMAASGLLDSWLSPDGSVSMMDDTEPVDVNLSHVIAFPGDTTLATVLAPIPVGGVESDVIHSALARVGWYRTRPQSEVGTTWLAADGSWRIGALTGRAEPAHPASYLGAVARETARLREIDRLESRLSELDSMIDSIDNGLADIQTMLTDLGAETRRVPPERPVTNAVSAWRERQQVEKDCQGRLSDAQTAHAKKQEASDKAWAHFAEYASEHAFPLHGLEKVELTLISFQSDLGKLESALGLLVVRQAALATAERSLKKQQSLLVRQLGEVTELAGSLRRARVSLHTATQALGADKKELLSRRDELDARITNLTKTTKALGDELTEAKVKAGTAQETLTTHEQRRLEAETKRDTALIAWWAVFDAGLAESAGLVEPDRRNVTSAREATIIARRETGVVADDVAVDRAWRRCYAQLDELRQHLLPNREAKVVDDVDGNDIPQIAVLTDSATGWQAPRDAADTLAQRVREQEGTFDAEQQNVLTTLLGSTFIEHLKDRLDYTERTFTNINKQLENHPTRHGHAVKLAWAADPADPDAREVVSALTVGYNLLSTTKQDTVRSFLARKIDAARADATADGAIDWKDQLSSALDYRGWLKISLQYRPGSTSKWAPFDAAKHGAKSGGEKVVLLSQPLFAAAVVAYDAASEICPRWVWLDEAMTGVDDEIKASFMGLTVSFDLDIMLTAHDEWCKYLTVPAVAVYDLARQKGLPGVDAMPYLWCGGEWTSFELPTANVGSAIDQLDSEGLFAPVADD